MNTEKFEKDIRTLNSRKVTQYSDIPTKTTKKKSDNVSDFVCTAINSSLKSFPFLSYLKRADITPAC